MTRFLRALAGCGATLSTAITLLATHWPTPNAVQGGENAGAAWVRGGWHALGEAAHHLPETPRLLDPLLDDKVLHFHLFFVPAVLWALALGKGLLAPRGRMLVGVLVAWSILDEGTQSATGREVECGDALANLLGVLTGLAAAWPVARWRSGRSKAVG